MKTLRIEDRIDTAPVEPTAVPPAEPPTYKPALELLTPQGRQAEGPEVPGPLAATPLPDPVLRVLARKAVKWMPDVLFSVLSIALMVGLWYLATHYQIDWYVRFTNIPPPGEVASELIRLGKKSTFYIDMWISLRRIVLGFGIATVFGGAMGLLIGRFKIVRQLLFPASEILRPIPAIAWVPMSIMLWPSNETSIVFITFIGSFFPILLNTIHGVEAIDPVLIRAARSLGASEYKVLRLVILKAALPHIFTGLAVGMGVAWVSLIAAEMISGQFGIGYFTWEAYSLVEYSHIVIGMVLIGVLGLFCSGTIRLIGRLMMPWMRPQAGGAH